MLRFVDFVYWEMFCRGWGMESFSLAFFTRDISGFPAPTFVFRVTDQRQDGSRTALRAQQIEDDSEEKKSVKDGKSNGAKHKDAELEEEENSCKQHKNGSPYGGACSRYDRHAHVAQRFANLVAARALLGSNVAVGEVNDVIDGEANNQRQVERLEYSELPSGQRYDAHNAHGYQADGQTTHQGDNPIGCHDDKQG